MNKGFPRCGEWECNLESRWHDINSLKHFEISLEINEMISVTLQNGVRRVDCRVVMVHRAYHSISVHVYRYLIHNNHPNNFP